MTPSQQMHFENRVATQRPLRNFTHPGRMPGLKRSLWNQTSDLKDASVLMTLINACNCSLASLLVATVPLSETIPV